MDNHIIKDLQDKISDITCKLHGDHAQVRFKERAFDFHVEACCPDFKNKIYKICAREKLKYLKIERSKMKR